MISTAAVLDAIEPVDPDQLLVVDPIHQVFEARWSPFNRNEIDVQRLKTHTHCEFVGNRSEPDNLRGWTAIQFRYL